MASCALCGRKLGWANFTGELEGKTYCKEHFNELIEIRKSIEKRKLKYAPSLIQGEVELWKGVYSGKMWTPFVPSNVEIVLTNFRVWAHFQDTLETETIRLTDVDDVMVRDVGNDLWPLYVDTYAGSVAGSYGEHSVDSSQKVGSVALIRKAKPVIEIPRVIDPQGFKQLINSVKKQTKPSYDQELGIARQEVRFMELKALLNRITPERFQQYQEDATEYIAELERKKISKVKIEERKRTEAKLALIRIVNDLLAIGIGEKAYLEALRAEAEAGRLPLEEEVRPLQEWAAQMNRIREMGKEMVITQVKKKQQETKEDALEQLKKLADLRNSGVITNEEFEGKKKEILSRL